MKDITTIKNNGFSLVELIASLTIAGILAVALMTIVVTALNGFSLTRDAAEITQKTNLALARIRIELLNATYISTADPYYVEYVSNDGASYKIAKATDSITLAKTSAPTIEAQTLVNKIADYGTESFLIYKQNSSTIDWTTSDWATTEAISELYAIVVKLKFENKTLETTINPRLNTLRDSPRFKD